MKTKIHEIVAVEKTVKSTYAGILSETQNTLTKKENLFQTHSKIYSPINEGDIDRPADDETIQPITTIRAKLNHFNGFLARLMDIILQKEEANTRAFADVIIEETNELILENVPVAALVQIENILESVRSNIYDAIPTLDPTKHWCENESKGDGSYVSEPVIRQSSKKINKPVTLFAGNDRHPPQVQMVTEDTLNGTWTITHYSGKITPAAKSALLNRVDLLLEAIKKARSRANETEINNLQIGKKLINFINTAIIS